MTSDRGLHSEFRPYLTVWEDGRIEVDFADSYEGTWNLSHPETVDDNREAIALVDRLVAYDGATPADALRRLADYLDEQDS